MYINVRVLSTPLTLCRDDDTPPAEAHRIGSVPIRFPDGHGEIIRVFGHTPLLDDKAARIVFERELRLICESPETLKSLFDFEGPAHSRRFNPSQAQRHRGWERQSNTIH